jgi:hypothetical protein
MAAFAFNLKKEQLEIKHRTAKVKEKLIKFAR